ncbi:MAG TPA: saccharopine dehydrogenase C-terminal domain-containing protein [Candidatus Acidoferrales bacterium]|nr:saccharopine dehydrogenase C-terminal domain-containing protein [Candidatus Acidoferrales bacterium]
MPFRVVVVGCGAQGKVISTYLSKSSEVEGVLLGDVNVEASRLHANRVGSRKLSAHKLNAGDVNAVAKLAEGSDIIVNAVPPRFNLALMDAALKSGTDYVDLAFGPPYDTFDKQMQKDALFKERKLTALTSTGSSPGIVNVVAAHAADELDAVKSIRLRIGDVMRSSEPVSTWSPDTMLGDMAEEPIVYENGQYKRVPPFSGEEVFNFPPPVGPQPTFMHVHEEAITLPRFIGKGLSYLDIKLGTPDMPLIKSLVDLGLCRTDPVDVDGVKVIPRNLLLRLFPPTPTPEEIQTKLASGIITDAYQTYVIEIVGVKGNGTITYTYIVTAPSLRQVQDTMPGATHESYLTGTSAAVFTEMLGEGRISTTGVIAPECLTHAAREEYLGRLAKLNVKIHLTSSLDVN